MIKITTLAIAAATAVFAATPGIAGIVFDSPANNVSGDCSFSTNCAAAVGRGNDFAAQLFTLTSAQTIQSGGFSAYVNFGSTQPSGVNFIFLDGTSGTPGAVIASGTASIASSSSIGTNFDLDLRNFLFNTGSITLGSGDYFFAVQGISSEFETYLGFANGTGAFETFDGGANWQAGYQTGSAIAVSLYDNVAGAVPEPATWALMIGGFGMVGAAARRRRLITA